MPAIETVLCARAPADGSGSGRFPGNRQAVGLTVGVSKLSRSEQRAARMSHRVARAGVRPSVSTDAVEALLEREVDEAERTLSGSVYHYTSLDTAVRWILGNGTIRMSSFVGTNDLWESRPLQPSLIGVSELDLTLSQSVDLWDQIDRYIRQFSKVACFTQDWALPDSVINPDAFRGWSHLAMWSHYGDKHAGVCLEFDRAALLRAFEDQASTAIHQFSGAVSYRAAERGLGPRGIDFGQLREFGVDAVALRYASTNRDQIFFRKHVDWQSEAEFRLVRTDLTLDPFEFDISEALTGVILGESFDWYRLDQVRAALHRYANASLTGLQFINRLLVRHPVTGAMESSPAGPPRSDPFEVSPGRPGGLEERLGALEAAEDLASNRRAASTPQADAVLEWWIPRFTSAVEPVSKWPSITISWGRSTSAVPIERRGGAPGTPGADVAHEAGLGVIVEHQPQRSFTLVGGLAVQILVTGGVRLHGVWSVETWLAAGNSVIEVWRSEKHVPDGDIERAAIELLDEFESSVDEVRAVFDTARR